MLKCVLNANMFSCSIQFTVTVNCIPPRLDRGRLYYNETKKCPKFVHKIRRKATGKTIADDVDYIPFGCTALFLVDMEKEST